MKQLEVPALPHLRKDSPLHLVAEALDALPQQAIDSAPWPAYDDKPDVKFAMAHNQNCLFLKYYVTERSVQAKYRKINDPVYKDSCVEFFISFKGEPAYYNLEFNCLGTCLAGFGKDRHDRKLLPPYKIAQIRHEASLKVANSDAPQSTWHLTLVIPAGVFSEHNLTGFTGKTGKANFYKCGDDLPIPHYLTWNTVQAPAPDFHLPEYFGEITFL